MEPATGLFEYFSLAAANSVDKEAVATLTGTDPVVGVLIMAVGLVGYAGCLCFRDRWWEW